MTKSRETAKVQPAKEYWFLAAFLVMLFAMGGASRIDVQSLVILEPLSVVACARALLTLRNEHLSGRRWLISMFIGLFAITLAHVIPLPPSIWQILPGRSDLIEVDKLVGLKGTWRPLTIAPMNGWHALASLLVPLAIILLGVQLRREDLFRILPLLIALTAVSGLIGLLQAIGNPQSSLYFYRITNHGSAVGLFANRNHAATLLSCLFPLLITYASTLDGPSHEVQFKRTLAVALAATVIPLIIVTGSRSGIIQCAIGLTAAVVLYRKPSVRDHARRGPKAAFKAWPVSAATIAISLGCLTYFFSRAEALDRMFSRVTSEDSRSDIWATSIDLLVKYFPWGSGSGSFVEAFQIAEPSNFLGPSFVNHAHNDWLEIAVTFGLPGILCLAVTTAAFLLRTLRLWRHMPANRTSTLFGRLASINIGIIAFASASDYPLRTPIMIGVFAILLLWLGEAGRPSKLSAPEGGN